MKKNLEFLRFALYAVIFLGAMYIPNDFDFGWHLKYGEYFVTHHQVLRDNIFSTEMTNYHWVNHEWFSDVISFLVFQHFGFFGTTLLGAAVITFCFFIFSKVAKFNVIEELLILPLMLYLEDAFLYVSYRGQLVSVTLIGVLLYLLQKAAKKSLLFIPLLFLLWANIHGGFLIGLGLFGIWIFSLFIKEFKKTKFFSTLRSLKYYGISFFLSVLTSLINPFGVGVYLEGLHHLGNKYLQYIIEWTPFELLSQLWWNHALFSILLALGILTLFFQNTLKNYLPIIAVTGVLLLFSYFERRYAWPMYFVALPLIKPLITPIVPQKIKTIFWTFLFGLLIFAAVIIASKYPFTQFTKATWDTYCDTSIACSPKAARYLSEIPHDKLLTYYGWGGWLIANYPSVKPSIDGRMHLWETNGYSAFIDYYGYEQNWKDITNSKYNVVFIPHDKPLYTQLINHVQDGSWSILYQDNKSAIFKHNSPL